MEMNRVSVTIFGQTYTIRGDADEVYIKKLARYVNEKMEEYSATSSSVNTTQVAILTALNIADELHQTRQISSGIDGAIHEKAMSLISMLDEGLIGETFAGIESINAEMTHSG